MTSTDTQISTFNARHHLEHLAIIEITGQDASRFLQGQLTCNVNEIDSSKASFAAFCNPKGRVISVLLLVKTNDGFRLILPRSLLEVVLKKLRMYILRAKVQINELSQSLQLLGLCCPQPLPEWCLPEQVMQVIATNTQTWIRLPSGQPRFIGILPKDEAFNLALQNFHNADESDWRYQDISSGIPWFDIEQSEQYIPQMLNLDQLGAISFNKGCYTGQEIVARTHYLGKAKRKLYLAECACSPLDEHTGSIYDASTQNKIGDILSWASNHATSRLLIVMHDVDAEGKTLILDNARKTAAMLIPFQ